MFNVLVLVLMLALVLKLNSFNTHPLEYAVERFVCRIGLSWCGGHDFWRWQWLCCVARE
jgi:hypothetical protein